MFTLITVMALSLQPPLAAKLPVVLVTSVEYNTVARGLNSQTYVVFWGDYLGAGGPYVVEWCGRDEFEDHATPFRYDSKTGYYEALYHRPENPDRPFGCDRSWLVVQARAVVYTTTREDREMANRSLLPAVCRRGLLPLPFKGEDL